MEVDWDDNNDDEEAGGGRGGEVGAAPLRIGAPMLFLDRERMVPVVVVVVIGGVDVISPGAGPPMGDP